MNYLYLYLISAVILFASIRSVSSQTITTVAGDGGTSSRPTVVDGVLATRTSLNAPNGVYVDPQGTIYIADTNNSRLAMIDPVTGFITTVPGSSSEERVDWSNLTDVYGDSSGALYFIALELSQVLQIKIDNSVVTRKPVAGVGTWGYNEDVRPAENSLLDAPREIFIDSRQNLFIADTSNHRIRMRDAETGLLHTVAGGNEPGYYGGGYNEDNQPATEAFLNQPQGIAVDETGNLYIADTFNHRIRKVDAETRIITTIAGTGEQGYNGDNQPATQARLNAPSGLCLDSTGNLYIADTFNNRVRRIDATTGIITTVAGTGAAGFNGDFQKADRAQLNRPYDVFIDSSDNLFIVDWLNHRIRKVVFHPNNLQRGDVNMDGKITIADATQVFYFFIGIAGIQDAEPPFIEGTQAWAADMNQDQQITPADAQAIYEFYLNASQ